MGAPHRARAHSIQIIKVEEVKAVNTRRPQVKQFHDARPVSRCLRESNINP
ncbi:Ribosomal L18ae domain containing protein [Asbolus verrucosus]|uniref:Ribosomal L18ae domain containing protein n=1 Tax=Asbolus verrucosus TaxID=1661398 RepID=A0A482VQZ3_ASBVE|nr:Ribosomal L18ae domain containing protein [Asbolus verrucosus]